MTPPVAFDNSYARLPERFFARVAPALASKPALVRVNRELAAELGLDADWLASDEGVLALSGQSILPGSEPIATAYAGHQFGNFVPQLGDGRAILLGELVDRHGRRWDIQLKGAGRTPFSRAGDGLAALGPVLREYAVSEAMAAMGIRTTRSLAAVTTGEPVYREKELPGAILTRIASSHIRVGTFQFFAARQDADALRELTDHVIARHYPERAGAENPALALLDAVVWAQAELVASWMLVGFIHGVMNTDNMSIAGETIDYGPCAFMDEYHPATVFSSIDQFGRYAYGNQPRIAQWDLARLAEALLTLIDPDPQAAVDKAMNVLDTFADRFGAAHQRGLAAKLGFANWREEDDAFANALFTAMAENKVDFTLFFRRLADAQAAGAGEEPVRSLFVDPTACDPLLAQWRARLETDEQDAADRRAAMRAVNPAFIPRNHRVEAMIAAAVDRQDYAPFEELLAVLSRPFDDQPGFERYADPPLEDERVTATFCGT